MFGCNTVPYKRLQRLFCHQCKYTAHAAKQRTGLYSVFSVDLTYSSAHNTVTTQADYTPPAPRWSVSQRRSISSAYHRYNRHAGRCTAQHSRPIIIMYIRVRRCYGSTPDSAAYHRPCQPGGVIPAACDLAPGQSKTPSTRRGSPAAGAWRAARNHWRLAPYLFSGFRPIANRGQQ